MRVYMSWYCFVAYMLVLLHWTSPAQHRVEPRILGDRIDVDVYGTVAVIDEKRNVLQLFRKEANLPVREIGGPGWDNNHLDRPSGLWARNGIDVFVADYGNHRIQRFDRGLNFISSLSTRENSNPDERFGYPTDVALSRLGDLFICDSENSRIVKVTRENKVERVFGGFDAGLGRVQNPTQLEIGPKDHIYVFDGIRIVVFDSFGNFLHELGGVFNNPVCIYADRDGAVVCDEQSLHFFDEGDRPAGSYSFAALSGKELNDVLDVAIARGTLYILTGKGLMMLPDPRIEMLLDKEKKSQ